MSLDMSGSSRWDCKKREGRKNWQDTIVNVRDLCGHYEFIRDEDRENSYMSKN